MKVVSALQALLYVSVLASGVSAEKGEVEELQIGVKYKPESCPIKSQNGDNLSMHYTGTLVNGDKFDSSVDRGNPFNFVLGAGRVIKGWDQGLQDMCIGEKRKLRIPAKLGYGSRGSPPKIPGGSTLIFDVELLDILNRKPLPHEQEAAATATATSVSTTTESSTSTETETATKTKSSTTTETSMATETSTKTKSSTTTESSTATETATKTKSSTTTESSTATETSTKTKSSTTTESSTATETATTTKTSSTTESSTTTASTTVTESSTATETSITIETETSTASVTEATHAKDEL